MFTGIIESVGNILEITPNDIRVAHPAAWSDVRVGSSVSVAGVCLTIATLDRTVMEFDLSGETVLRTTLGNLRAGDRVNLERAMRADGRFEGHMVQGHVEGVGTVKGLRTEDQSPPRLRPASRGLGNNEKILLMVALPEMLLTFVVAKGSITLDGVSLTVAGIEGNHVTVALIPHTLTHTTLGSLQEGDRVNVETDVIARYLRRFITPSHAHTSSL